MVEKSTMHPSCRALRRSILDILQSVRRGHLASAFSVVEILRALYDQVLHYNPADPQWPERDRFILSKGHGCLALYALLAEKGFFAHEELKRVAESGSFLGGHPERGRIPGIECSTGSLGHGLSVGVGMALHLKMCRSQARVFVLLGDGECNEGSVWEAALGAAKHKLENLCVLIDLNAMQSFGPTQAVLDMTPFSGKWRSFGFQTREIDGHDLSALQQALSGLPFAAEGPSALICRTIKGKGVSGIEQNPEWHHKNNITDREMEVLYQTLEQA